MGLPRECAQLMATSGGAAVQLTVEAQLTAGVQFDRHCVFKMDVCRRARCRLAALSCGTLGEIGFASQRLARSCIMCNNSKRPYF